MTTDGIIIKIRDLIEKERQAVTGLRSLANDELGMWDDEADVIRTVALLREAIARRQAYDIVLAMLEDTQPSDD